MVRHFQNGFAIAFSATVRKRDKLASQLTWLAKRAGARPARGSPHERVQPRIPRTVITLDTGQSFVARLIDVSTSGASISTDIKLAMDSRIIVGKLPAKVVRIFEGGVAVEFGRILSMPEIESDVSVPI